MLCVHVHVCTNLCVCVCVCVCARARARVHVQVDGWKDWCSFLYYVLFRYFVFCVFNN
jgi:hypothetical protein